MKMATTNIIVKTLFAPSSIISCNTNRRSQPVDNVYPRHPQKQLLDLVTSFPFASSQQTGSTKRGQLQILGAGVGLILLHIMFHRQLFHHHTHKSTHLIWSPNLQLHFHNKSGQRTADRHKEMVEVEVCSSPRTACRM